MGLTINPLTGKLGSGTPSLRFNPLAGEFQFSGGTNRTVFDPKTGGFVFASQQGEIDPLAGIAYRLRFETTWGGGVLRPMWQDDARTTLAAAEFDPVATMGPGDAELIPAQPTGDAKPLIFLAGDGTPYLDYDAIDDTQECGIAGGQVVYTVLIRSKTNPFNTFYAPIDAIGAFPLNEFWGFFQGGTTNFFIAVPPDAVRLNGVDLVSPFDVAPITDWMVITVVSQNAAVDHPRWLCQLGSGQFGDCEVIGMFMYDGIPSNGDRNTVEAFYATLIPS